MKKIIESVIRKPGDIELIEAPMPELSPGEGLVRLSYAAICGTDMHIYQGKYPAELPKIVGHECSGVIERINAAGELPFKAGDRVAVQPFLTCGHCDACITGHGNACVSQKFFGTKTDGCFTQYMKVPLNRVCRIPDNVDQRLGCMTEPLAVGVHAVRESGFMVGETALVLGAGPIGLMLALVLRMAGATNIVLTEMSPYRIRFAEDMGFKIVNPADGGAAERLLEINGGDRYHKVFEATAAPASYELMFETIKARGVIMLLGLTSQKHPFNTTACVFQEAQVRALRIHSMESFRYALRILGSGLLSESVSRLMTHEFDFNNIKDAMEFAVNDQEHIKVTIKF
jgi:2-desacetyl-2-hydroxyethyl bacteriochlorophyllide A dehydrogenase